MTYFPTGRIAPAVMNSILPATAEWIFKFQRDDIQARLLLIDVAEAEWNQGSGDLHASEKALHASDYLTNRALYQAAHQ
jgi:hypothetical protein